jgi:cytosine/adenosine deaminase-related metal-dependent hydrolase
VGLGRCSDELLVKSKEMADRYGALLNLHECAFVEQVEDVKRRTGLTPIAHMERLGVLGPNVALVHMIHVTDEEIAILKRHEARVIHCPTTALKLTYGLSRAGRFPEMMEAGVTVAIGSDCGDCSNYNDMIRVMYLAALLFKDARFNAKIMGAETALEMATLAGARALGLENEIGSLEPGKKADIVLVTTRRADWVPVHNEIYNLIYSASASSVDTVLVDGCPILEGGIVKTVDEAEVLARTQELATDVRRRAGLEPTYRWPVE